MRLKNLYRFSGSQSAFSLIELMIGLLIFAVLIAGVVFALFSSRPAYQLERLKTDLSEAQKVALETLKRDLNSAIRNDGFSQSSLPGIGRFPDSPRINPTDNDGLEIIVEKFGQYSTNAFDFQRIPSGANAGDYFKAYLPEASTEPEARQFFIDALPRKAMLFLTSLENTSMVKQVIAPTVSGNEATIKIQSNPDFNPANLNAQILSLRAAERIRYFVNPNQQLIRQVVNDFGGASTETQIAEGVSLFQIDYGFQNRRKGVVDLDVPPKTQRLSHPNDPSYRTCPAASGEICCDNPTQCVAELDIADVKIRIQLSKPISERLQSLTGGLDSRFAASNGQLRYTGEEIIFPRRYSVRSEDVGQLGLNLTCPENDMNSRCKPECFAGVAGSPFDNPNMNGASYPANWTGYGDPSSDYCQCGGCVFNNGAWDCSNFHVPESSAWNPAWIPNFQANGGDWWTDPSNRQINACLRHFNGCSSTGGVSGWQAKHPAAYLACQCLQPSDPMGNSNPQTPFNKWTNQSRTVAGQPNLSYTYREWDKSAITSANIQPNSPLQWAGQAVVNPQMCYQWPACDGQAQALFGSPSTLWENECNCRTYGRTFAGNEGGSWVHRMLVRWDRLCNLEHRQNPNAPVTCQNTWDSASDTMKITGCVAGQTGCNQTYQNALDREDAALCECLAQTGHDQNNTADSWNYDFRTGPELEDFMMPVISAGNYLTPPIHPTANVYPAAQYPSYNFGGNQSSQVSFNAKSIDGDVSINRVCNAAYCPLRHSWGLALGCCTHPNRDLDQNSIDDSIPISTVNNLLNGPQGDFRSYINYCSAHCLGGRTITSQTQNGDPRNVNEIQRVREIITGTGPNAVNAIVAPVPIVCGDPYANSGGGL